MIWRPFTEQIILRWLCPGSISISFVKTTAARAVVTKMSLDSNGLAEGLSLWVTLAVVPLSSACCETKISRFFSWNIFETSDAAQLENPNMKWIMNLHGCSEACFDGYLSEVRMASWLSKPMLNRQWLGSWFDTSRTCQWHAGGLASHWPLFHFQVCGSNRSSWSWNRRTHTHHQDECQWWNLESWNRGPQSVTLLTALLVTAAGGGLLSVICFLKN